MAESQGFSGDDEELPRALAIDNLTAARNLVAESDPDWARRIQVVIDELGAQS